MIPRHWRSSKELKLLIDSKENWPYFCRNPGIICKTLRTQLLPSLCLVNSFYCKLSAQMSPPELKTHLQRETSLNTLPLVAPGHSHLQTRWSCFRSLITPWNHGHIYLLLNSLSDSPKQNGGSMGKVPPVLFTAVHLASRPGLFLDPRLFIK